MKHDCVALKLIAIVSVIVTVMIACASVGYGEESETVSFGEFQFEDVFLHKGEEPVLTDDKYKSENISIEIRKFRQDNSDVFVADIYIKSLDMLQRVYGFDKWGYGSQAIGKMAERHSAVLAITGDDAHVLEKGIVYGNGQLLRKTINNSRELGIIFMDGTMEIMPGRDVKVKDLEALEKDIWHLFLFGPGLLDENGKAKTQFTSKVRQENPRAVIGYYEPGHYCFVQVDGRKTKSVIEDGKKNYGMTLAQLATLMEQLGCKAAYNLDGGRSSMMWFNGQVLNNPEKGGRKIGDIICIPEI